MAKARFEWDPPKDQENQEKHGVAFAVAQLAFADSRRVIARTRIWPMWRSSEWLLRRRPSRRRLAASWRTKKWRVLLTT